MDLAGASFSSRSVTRSRLDQLRLDQLSHSFGAKRGVGLDIPYLRLRSRTLGSSTLVWIPLRRHSVRTVDPATSTLETQPCSVEGRRVSEEAAAW